MKQKTLPRSLTAALTGRCFVHPLFDYLLIGGGLSLALTAIVVMNPAGTKLVGVEPMWYLVMLGNSAHFAASTVRLYTKPGAVRSMPFLSKAVPPIAIGLMTLCVLYVGRVGPLLDTLYLTWSPYHYSAQAYGLAVMYCYRSGCQLAAPDKKLLRRVCLIPFLYMAAQLLEVHLPDSARQMFPIAAAQFASLKRGLAILGVVAPFLLFAKVWRARSGPMPIISLLTVVSNAIWFFVLDPMQAFIWATVFHGIQYLAIVLIFDVKDRMSLPGGSRAGWFHVAWFYGVCLGLGYTLFILLPKGYAAMGFDSFDVNLVAIASVNIHHFIVDAYIWRLGREDTNSRIVAAAY
jgi:hypothetical protein